MKQNTVIIAATAIALLAMASCQKENAQVTAKPEANGTATKTISGEQQSYDYSQPVEKIIADAIAGSTDRVKRVFNDRTNSVELKPGHYLGDDPQTGETMCLWVGFVCEIIVTPDVKSNQLYSASIEDPIGVIQPFEKWPVARLATEVSYRTDDEGNIRIRHTFID